MQSNEIHICHFFGLFVVCVCVCSLFLWPAYVKKCGTTTIDLNSFYLTIFCSFVKYLICSRFSPNNQAVSPGGLMRDDIMETLCTLLVHLGSEFVIFLPLLGTPADIYFLGCLLRNNNEDIRIIRHLPCRCWVRLTLSRKDAVQLSAPCNWFSNSSTKHRLLLLVFNSSI